MLVARCWMLVGRMADGMVGRGIKHGYGIFDPDAG